jgi:predicted nucleic acid-binding protein
VIVLDASAVIEVLLRTSAGNRIENRIYSKTELLHAPYLIEVEVAQVIRRFAAAGLITPARGAITLQYLNDMQIIRHSHSALLQRIWHLRENLTAYDAAYVALAEALDAPLLTCDGRLARTKNHRARIELIPIQAK